MVDSPTSEAAADVDTRVGGTPDTSEDRRKAPEGGVPTAEAAADVDTRIGAHGGTPDHSEDRPGREIRRRQI